MKSKHTPGPWNAVKTKYQGLVISENTGDTVAVTHDPKDRNMVAAAPDMYEALVELLQSAEYIYRVHIEEISGGFKLAQDIRRAQAAIYKAEGF